MEVSLDRQWRHLWPRCAWIYLSNVGFIIQSTVLWMDDTAGMKGGRVKWMLELNKADFFFEYCSHINMWSTSILLTVFLHFAFLALDPDAVIVHLSSKNSCKMIFWNPAGMCFRFHEWIEGVKLHYEALGLLCSNRDITGESRADSQGLSRAGAELRLSTCTLCLWGLAGPELRGF